MSIIIAKIESDSCLFRSDTKVSIFNGDKTVIGNNKLRLSPEEGILKIHILNQNICIAFAGTVDVCSEIIYNLCNKQPNDNQYIFQFVQYELIKASDNSAFIIAFVNKNKQPRLFKVDKNTIEEGTSFWIGVREAYSEFQSYFQQINKNQSILDKTVQSFREMIRSTNIDTVGDFIIGAYYNQKYNSFAYEESHESIGGYGIIKIKANITTILSEGSVEEGTFSVSNLVSNRTDKPAICLFFDKGNLAYLYIPISKTNKNTKPIVIENISIDELKKIVLEKFGITLFGYTMNLGHFKKI